MQNWRKKYNYIVVTDEIYYNYIVITTVVYFNFQNISMWNRVYKEQRRKQYKYKAQKFKDMAGAILLGNGLGGLIQGTLGGAVFAFFGFQSPFLWGVIMALLAFLPIVGIGIVFLPASIFLFLKDGNGLNFVFLL